MATAYSDLVPQPIQTIDPNGPYAQGMALAQQQMGQQGQVNALATSPAPNMPPQAQSQPAQTNALASPQPASTQPMPNALAVQAAAAPAGVTPDMVNAAIAAQRHQSLRDVIGTIGDALAGFGGHAPTYAPWRQARLEQQTFADWQANPSDPQAQANYLASDPATAFTNMAALQSNRLANMKTVAELQQQQRANAATAATNAATILKGIRDKGGDVGAAYDQLRGTGQLDAIGMHPGEHDYWRDLLVSTPGALDQLAAAPTTATVDGGANAPKVVIDTRTGRPIATGIAGVVPMTSDQRPFATVGTDPSAATAPQATAGVGAPASAPGAAAAPGAPRGVRNNNGGNIRDGAFAQSQPGYVGADPDGFAIFNKPAAGVAAQERLLMGKKYFGGGNNTVRGIVSTYLGNGPENSAESKANYIKSVASQMGVDPDAPIPSQNLRQLAGSMRNFENGSYGASTPVTAPGSIQRGATAPTSPASPDGIQPGHWLEDDSSGQLSQPAIRNAAVQHILTGQYPPNLGRGGITQKAILNQEAAMGYSQPQIEAIQSRHTSDVAALKQLGSSATYIQAQEGAARANADLVLQKSAAVPRSSWPTVNELRNGINRHSGDANITALDTALNTFIGQFATVMGNGTPSDSLRAEGAHLLDPSLSDEQLRTNIATMKQDMANRSAAFAKTYQETSDRVGSVLPTAVNSADQARGLPKGTRFITPDGRIKVR